MTLATKLVELAENEVGIEEVDGTNCGPRVNQYKSATNLPAAESWPWCAAFICWLVREAMNELGIAETATFKRPTTAGAWDFENWSKRQDNTTLTRRSFGSDVRPGDIVIFTFSHIGLAVGTAREGHVQIIEGNTDKQGSREGGGVFVKTRPLSKIKATIRFTI